MAYTTQQLVDLINNNIQQHSSLDRITAAEARQTLMPIVTELASRGVKIAQTAATMAGFDGSEASFFFLYGSGIYFYSPNTSNPPAPNGGSVLAGLNGVWILVAGTVDGANTIQALLDVYSTGWAPQDGDVLTYDASTSKWRPSTPGGAASAYKTILFAEPDIVPGQTTFTNAQLAGASQVNYIIVNKVIEFLGDDFTFDSSTGTIDRAPNQFLAGDKMVVPHKK